jgi:hypothetical protein
MNMNKPFKIFNRISTSVNDSPMDLSFIYWNAKMLFMEFMYTKNG